MLKNLKKILLPIAALVLTLGVGLGIYFGFTGKDAYADTDNTSPFLYVEGAQVRTTGEHPGLRFVGKVEIDGFTKSYGTDVAEFGILLAFGDAEPEEIVIGGTVNEKAVKCFSITPSELEANDYTHCLTIYNIPAEYYGQKMTTLMYAKLADGTIIYGDEAQTRDLADVSRQLYNTTTDEDLADPTDNLIKKVAEACRVKVTDESGNVSFHKDFAWGKNTSTADTYYLNSTVSNIVMELVRGTYENKLYLYPGMHVLGAYCNVEIDEDGNRAASDIVDETILT